MMKQVKIRLEEEDYKKLEEIAQKHGKSVTELVKQVVLQYLHGIREDEIPEKINAKKFKAKKQLKCYHCGEQINPGELAIYVEYLYRDGKKHYEIWHCDCWEFSSDSSLGKLYVEKRKLKRIISNLRKQADALADKVIALKRELEILQIYRDVKGLISIILETFTDDSKWREVSEKLDDINRRLIQLEEETKLEEEMKLKRVLKERKE